MTVSNSQAVVWLVKVWSVTHLGQISGGSHRDSCSGYDSIQDLQSHSCFLNCKTQTGVDELWEKLSADPEAEQCGWLKDKHGVSWQIIPTILNEMLQDEDPMKSERVMKAILQMKKIDMKTIQEAYEQN